jgi:hypothetical protein
VLTVRGAIMVWIGLMGLAATVGVSLLLRTFPRAFVESGPAAEWPWRAGASRAARVRGGLLFAAAIVSACVAVAGVVSFLS